jgi:phage/plasmid-associated DNA primase
VIECNRRPAINDTDDGIWRRLKILPFKHQMPEDRIDPTCRAS